MNHSFNLLDQPWIPCVMLDGSAQELGIRDTLLRAHGIAEIYDDSPLVTVALHRLLLAILYRCWDFHREEDWEDWWEKTWPTGSFPSSIITGYLDKWKDRFDLFSETHPFYQTAGLVAGPVPINRIATQMANGNNPVLFDHTSDEDPPIVKPAECARLLVATQCFNLGGLLRMNATLDGEAFTWAREENSIVMPGAAIWLSGGNLFQTLMLCLTPTDRGEDDLPCWELDRPADLRNIPPDSKTPLWPARGVVDRYTWQSRLIHLRPEETGDGNSVRYLDYTFGRSADTSREDPMLGYLVDKKEGWKTFRLSEARASWRDSNALLVDLEGFSQIPAIVRRANRLTRDIETARVSPTLHVAGLASYQAKIYLWRHDRLPIPAEILSSDQKAIDAKARLVALLDEAEDMSSQLNRRIRRAVSLYLVPQSAQMEGRQANPDDVTHLCDAIDPRRSYWSRLEHHFHILLSNLLQNADAAADTWRDAIEKEARGAFIESCTLLGTSALAIQAVARVSPHFQSSGRPKENGDSEAYVEMETTA